MASLETALKAVPERTKDVTDVAAVSTTLAAYFQYLPEIAAFLAIVWTLIRIYEWARIRLLRKSPTKGIDP